MKFKTKRRLLIIFIITLSFAAMFSLKNMRPEPKKKTVQTKSMLIEVLELEAAEIVFDIKSQGTVKPRTETFLSAEVSGRIIHVSDNFIPGGVFKKGETLVQIDPTNYLVAVEQAEALLQQRQIEFDGAKLLRSKGYRAEAELAAAKTSLKSAKVALVRSQENLDRTKIRLPYDGLVRSKNADLGQFINPGSHIGTTFAVNIAEVRLSLSDHDLAFLDLPETQFYSSESNEGPMVTLSAIRKGQYQEWDAQIVRTEGVVDEKSRVTYVVAQVNDPYGLNTISTNSNKVALPIGTFVRANIKSRLFPDIIKVPRVAIRGKDELMYIDKESTLQIRKVNILRADTKYAYIQDGISPGDNISITAIESPINGMKVRTGTDETTIDKNIATKSSDVNNEDDHQQAQAH